MGRVVGAAFLSCIIAGEGALPASQGAEAPVAIVAEYDGIIHPIAAEFFDEVIARADTSGAAVTVFVLRTPGGLLDSTRTIVSRMIAARTPVIVFVGPAGTRAASAGFIIALAADVAVMAPGTHIGAAHPVSAGGESKPDETMAMDETSRRRCGHPGALNFLSTRRQRITRPAVAAHLRELNVLGTFPSLITLGLRAWRYVLMANSRSPAA